jgi:hypothetical protein
MGEIPHNNREKWVSAQPVAPLSKASRAAIKAHRTKRIKKRLAPFDAIDAEVVALIERVTPPEGEEMGTNTARVILQAQTLRKELLLGRLKAKELERRAESLDVLEEWEEVKRELGICA